MGLLINSFNFSLNKRLYGQTLIIMKTRLEKKKLFRKLDKHFGEESSDVVVQIIKVEMEEILKHMDVKFEGMRRIQTFTLSAIGFVTLLMTIFKFIA